MHVVELVVALASRADDLDGLGGLVEDREPGDGTDHDAVVAHRDRDRLRDEERTVLLVVFIEHANGVRRGLGDIELAVGADRKTTRLRERRIGRALDRAGVAAVGGEPQERLVVRVDHPDGAVRAGDGRLGALERTLDRIVDAVDRAHPGHAVDLVVAAAATASGVMIL